jgi:hypothetical protein
MATVDRSESRPALDATFEAFQSAIDAQIAGRHAPPSGTVFMPADVATREMIERHRKDGPVIIIDENYEVTLPRDRTRELVVGGLLVFALSWLAGRRSGISRAVCRR